MESLEEVDAAIEYINRPFIDSRPEEERQLYKKQQDQNRRYRRDLYQHERYKQVLGDDAPKSLRSFRKMKREGGEKWDYLQLEYTRRNKLVQNPNLALPNAEYANVADEKFKQYFFGGEKEKGLSKGVLFDRRLGYNINNWEGMRTEIFRVAKLYPSRLKSEAVKNRGIMFNQKVILRGIKEKPLDVTLAWEIRDAKPWLVTIVPAEKAKK
jgi:hypothetical protein